LYLTNIFHITLEGNDEEEEGEIVLESRNFSKSDQVGVQKKKYPNVT
jgi:hypothetical protein